jgi:hypothetical protein
MRLWALRNRVRDLFGLAPVPPPHGAPVPPTPRIRVEMAGAVPGALVRLAPGVLLLVVALIAGCAGAGWVLAGVAAVGVTCWPGSAVAAGFTALTGVWVIAGGDLLAADPVTGAVPGVWRMAGLMLTVHLMLVAAAFAAHCSWRSVVERAVLLRVLRGVLGTQAGVQSLLLLVAWLRAWQPAGQEWLRPVAVLAVVGVAALALPREWLVRRARRRTE